jgi:hypothetical protein
MSMEGQVERLPGTRASATEMLITKRGMDSARPEVYRLDLARGGMARIVANDHDIRKWVSDNAGRVRVAIGAPERNRPATDTLVSTGRDPGLEAAARVRSPGSRRFGIPDG